MLGTTFRLLCDVDVYVKQDCIGWSSSASAGSNVQAKQFRLCQLELEILGRLHYSKFDIILSQYFYAIMVIDTMYTLNIIVVLRHSNSCNYFIVNSNHNYSESFTCNSLTQLW
jgi:hypothetical protein